MPQPTQSRGVKGPKSSAELPAGVVAPPQGDEHRPETGIAVDRQNRPEAAPIVFGELAAAGSDDRLGRLLESYNSYLSLLARLQIGKRIQGKVDPADIVQETFLEVHRQIERFRGTTEAEFLAWLRTILAGRIATVMRRFLGTKGRDLKLERDIAAGIDQSSVALDGGLVASMSTPSQHASRREQSVLLADALSRLPPDYRETIVLRQIEGLPFAEVAARMGRSEDSVQKLWVRALASLRRSLGAHS